MKTNSNVKRFDDWMRKIKNKHYANNESMVIAYDKVLEMDVKFQTVKNDK